MYIAVPYTTPGPVNSSRDATHLHGGNGVQGVWSSDRHDGFARGRGVQCDDIASGPHVGELVQEIASGGVCILPGHGCQQQVIATDDRLRTETKKLTVNPEIWWGIGVRSQPKSSSPMPMRHRTPQIHHRYDNSRPTGSCSTQEEKLDKTLRHTKSAAFQQLGQTCILTFGAV